MNRSKPTAIRTMLVLLIGTLGASSAQAQSTNVHLRLEPRTNALDMVVDGSANSGAFFIYQAYDLQSLFDSPSVAVQTNTPLTNGWRFSIPTPGARPSQASSGRPRAGGGCARELRSEGGGAVAAGPEANAAGPGRPRLASAVTILYRTSVNHQPMKEQTV